MLRIAGLVVSGALSLLGLLSAVHLGRALTSAPVRAVTAVAPAAPAPPPSTTTVPDFKRGPVVTFRSRVTAAPAAVAPSAAGRAWTWDQLADCESGNWGPGKVPVPGSAHWNATRGLYQGGLQFDARTWDHYRALLFADFPADAQDASRVEQIVVGERVLADQGARAWPTCGPRIGMTGDGSTSMDLPAAGPPDVIDDDLAG